MSDRVLCRATVNLSGAPLGTEWLLDPSDAEHAALIAKELFVPVAEMPAEAAGSVPDATEPSGEAAVPPDAPEAEKPAESVEAKT